TQAVVIVVFIKVWESTASTSAFCAD
ncbi:MAG: hypothetical protein QOE08_1494, partial [Thermoleophilaceae bacterium]|nr:hypothetical protein [Thermoleophilaceae bacterium]